MWRNTVTDTLGNQMWCPCPQSGTWREAVRAGLGVTAGPCPGPSTKSRRVGMGTGCARASSFISLGHHPCTVPGLQFICKFYEIITMCLMSDCDKCRLLIFITIRESVYCLLTATFYSAFYASIQHVLYQKKKKNP